MRRPFALILGGMLALAGCHHRAPRVAPLPAAPPDITPVMVSVPPPTHPTEPLPSPAVPAASAPVSIASKPRKPHKRRVAPTPAPPPVQTATVAPPPIELGLLSAGGDAGKGLRAETEAMLAAQRQRLEHLPAPVLSAHLADVEQARRFVKGADDAWKAGDVEGAHTLVVKAKVLLDDLAK